MKSSLYFNHGLAGMLSRGGFTLVEVIVTLAILVVLAAFLGTVGYEFYRSQAFISERDSVLSLLRNARTQALNNIDQANHGVYIDSGSYVIFEGASYASRNTALDQSYPRLPGVSVTGPNEIVFQSPDGASNVSGTIALTSGSAKASIALNYEGRINW